MAKLADVAALAGVSVTTVSRVINNYGSLSEKTKQKVFTAMQELNYQPNSLARSLQGKKTQLIGLIFPGVSNPFFGELVQTLESQLFQKGYRVMLCNSLGDAQKERSYVRMLLANQVDGIIAGAHNLTIPEYQEIKAPLISFDRDLGETIPIVSSDNYTGARLATGALLETGAQDIWLLTGANDPGNPTNERLRGYQTVLAENHLAPTIVELPFAMAAEVKWTTIQQKLSQHVPEGIFATDDMTAIMTIQIAHSLGIKIPEQLRVIGYDGTALIRNYYPDLATIVQPITAISALLIELLLKRIQDPQIQLEDRYVLPVKRYAAKSLLGN
ncbi:LacI family DNA-binding transcriptional regulator [Lactobacillus sp. DCY120]|uniref:LacI family DNA-binding transcriptional regulator n=1 Tax=Bombilactobacillus apium TaxID=2675299 RepID=A0A850QY63_9LACO|nr:LacI family DNA-binding transcriptional regulator [Bombilactobacillus apium]NVY95593.1 LacI family DNA-binding transcriptional regulator [Bombilactobacillus apium]